MEFDIMAMVIIDMLLDPFLVAYYSCLVIDYSNIMVRHCIAWKVLNSCHVIMC